MSRQRLEQAEILRLLRAALPELRNTYKVSRLDLFGSHALGSANRRSDVDLLVEFDEAPSLLRFVEMQLH